MLGPGTGCVKKRPSETLSFSHPTYLELSCTLNHTPHLAPPCLPRGCVDSARFQSHEGLVSLVFYFSRQGFLHVTLAVLKLKSSACLCLPRTLIPRLKVCVTTVWLASPFGMDYTMSVDSFVKISFPFYWGNGGVRQGLTM